MATAEFDPQTVIVGCRQEVDRLTQWLAEKHTKFIADYIAKPRIRGWLFWREIYYESAECAEKVWRGDFEEWEFESPKWISENRYKKWTQEINAIQDLAYLADKEGTKVRLSEMEVRNIWPET